jgi:anti-sigma regulatory factor (Ser/Thr protein kinase)
MSAIEHAHLGQGRWARDGHRSLSATYPAVPAAVPSARRAVVQFATSVGAAGEQLEAIKLAASEAFSNAVLHAYPEAGGVVTLAGWCVEGELWLLIADDGCGLRAGANGTGLGLGLVLISQVTDGLSIIDRASGGTELQMRFDLVPTRAAPPWG